ncbi:hypothetical protein BK011_00255 [Tenericutes bacterium MZ-XQ]|nr:hypothetical protein BK011_00255 [Tenericutes bacterium MZ-XQ]
MKFLFKVIVLPILSIVAIPLITLAILYKSVEIPVEDFTSDGDTVVLADMITEEMDAFLENNDSESVITLGVAQKEANLLLKETFLSMNSKFLDENATDDEKNYVLKEDMYGYQGTWVNFDEDIVEIESGIHIFVANFTYKTRLLITFKLEADTEEIVLTLDKLTIGNLPLAWAFGAADWAVTQITGNDLEETINDQLNGVATFNPTTREIRVEVQTLVDSQFQDDPQQAALINSLMAFVDENELFEIGFTDGSFDASLALGKTKDATPPFELDAADRIMTEADLTAMLESKATSLILSTLSTTTNPYIEFGELTLNKVLDYMLKDQQVSPGVLQEVVMFENYVMKAYVPYVSMTDTEFVVNIPLNISSIAEPTHQFQTIIKIDATPTISGSDLVITLNELTAGEVSVTNEHLPNIVTLLGDTNLIVDGNIVIQNFDQQMNQAGMSIESVEVTNSKLRMYVVLSDSIPLGDIQDAIEGVLGGISDNPEVPAEVNDAIDDVLNSITDPQGDPEQAVEDFMETFEGLSEEDQQAVYDALQEEFQNSEYSLEDILGLVP